MLRVWKDFSEWQWQKSVPPFENRWTQCHYKDKCELKMSKKKKPSTNSDNNTDNSYVFFTASLCWNEGEMRPWRNIRRPTLWGAKMRRAIKKKIKPLWTVRTGEREPYCLLQWFKSFQKESPGYLRQWSLCLSMCSPTLHLEYSLRDVDC